MTACRYRMILAIGFVIIIVLPFVQKATKAFPSVTLTGREAHVAKADWSLRSLWSGAATRQFEAYFSRKVGFRGVVVKAVNQLNFSVLGKLTGNMGTPIILGEDHWLYEHEYVRHYVRELGMNDVDRKAFVTSVKQLQDALAARDIPFVLVISPSKAEIYPEHLPEQYRIRDPNKPSNRVYPVMRPELAAAGVSVFDVRLLFEALKPTSEILYAKTGTHWNYYGSFLACSRMLQELKETQGLDVVIPQLDSVVFEPGTGTDTDLLNLLNLLRFGTADHSLSPYPKVSVSPVAMESRPNVLVVGDSFSFTLLDSLNLTKAVAEIDLLYYFKRHFRYPAVDEPGYVQDHVASEIGSIKYDEIDWQRLLLEKDLVILEINEIMLLGRGWGFVDHALRAIESAP
jgi:alginate O-acetyltransferase complex protein AlgJ